LDIVNKQACIYHRYVFDYFTTTTTTKRERERDVKNVVGNVVIISFETRLRTVTLCFFRWCYSFEYGFVPQATTKTTLSLGVPFRSDGAVEQRASSIIVYK